MINYNWIDFSLDMSLYSIRKHLFNYYDNLLSDKIRVYSLVYKSSKEVCEKLWLKFEWFFLAIGEINHKSFSKQIQENAWLLYNWNNYNKINKRKLDIVSELEEDGIIQYQYDITWSWYSKLRKLLSIQEYYRTWIQYKYNDDNNEIFVVNWASFWLKMIFEMFYRDYWRKVKAIFPIPMFVPVLQSSDIFLEPIIFETKEKNNFKITENNIRKLFKDYGNIDIFYLCLLNNPTSILYTKDEVESILKLLFSSNTDIKIVIDWVYIAWGNINEVHDIFNMISKYWWLNNIFLIDWEWKAKARTWKRNWSVYIKDKYYSNLFSNILRNSTWWISSDSMIDSISTLQCIDKNISQEIYLDISKRRSKFLDYIFNNELINKYLINKNNQPWIVNWFEWQWWLYVFLKLKKWVDVKEFILNTWIIWTPWGVFWSNKYQNYIRLSFWYENIL